MRLQIIIGAQPRLALLSVVVAESLPPGNVRPIYRELDVQVFAVKLILDLEQVRLVLGPAYLA